MGTVTGTLVSEGGPRPSIAFVHDDPTLCSAAEWWSGLARAAAALVVAFALAGVAASLAAEASVAGLAVWVLAGGAGGALLQLAATVRREYRLGGPEPHEPPGPAPQPALHRLAGALLALGLGGVAGDRDRRRRTDAGPGACRRGLGAGRDRGMDGLRRGGGRLADPAGGAPPRRRGAVRRGHAAALARRARGPRAASR